MDKKDIMVENNVVDRNVHDIKNQLMIIMSMTNNISDIAENDDVKKYSYFIKETVYNCRYMLSNIDIDINEVSNENNNLINMHYVLKSLLDSFCLEKDIIFVDKMNAGNPRIYAHKVSMINAVYNVLLNAVQAVEWAGTITINTCNKKKNKYSDFECTQWLCIEIADDGNGIKKEYTQKVFEENFTTKKNKRGIGLYSAKRTIEKYNGTINIKSSQSEGATFVISIPCHVE